METWQRVVTFCNGPYLRVVEFIGWIATIGCLVSAVAGLVVGYDRLQTEQEFVREQQKLLIQMNAVSAILNLNTEIIRHTNKIDTYSDGGHNFDVATYQNNPDYQHNVKDLLDALNVITELGAKGLLDMSLVTSKLGCVIAKNTMAFVLGEDGPSTQISNAHPKGKLWSVEGQFVPETKVYASLVDYTQKQNWDRCTVDWQ